MERKPYLELCQRCAVLPDGVMHTKIHIPDECKVTYNGVEYYPAGYKLTFDVTSKAVHIAILHDLNANCVIEVPLSSVRSVI